MGHYTSIVISCRLKRETPIWILTAIESMIDGPPAKELIGDSAHRSPINGSSQYFPEPVTTLQHGKYSFGSPSLFILSNIKNYHDELMLLVKALQPWVESGHGEKDWWAIITPEDGEPCMFFLEDVVDG